jgi:DNA integrity scanning protein DisA with diadenylate cyclase activity
VVSSDGVVYSAGRILDAPAKGLTLSKGLGARHWAAAAISKATEGIAITVSESTGTVRLFQDGIVVLRIEPLDRAMKFHEFETEPPPDME